MSNDNAELLRGTYEAFGRGGFPHGTFTGPVAPPSVIGDALTGWEGRFAGRTLTGTVTTSNSCIQTSEPLIATFLSRPGDAARDMPEHSPRARPVPPEANC